MLRIEVMETMPTIHAIETNLYHFTDGLAEQS
jgi:hypothetical protein